MWEMRKEWKDLQENLGNALRLRVQLKRKWFGVKELSEESSLSKWVWIQAIPMVETGETFGEEFSDLGRVGWEDGEKWEDFFLNPTHDKPKVGV